MLKKKKPLEDKWKPRKSVIRQPNDLQTFIVTRQRVNKANRESSWNASSWDKNNKNDDTSKAKTSSRKDVTPWVDKTNRVSS